MVKICVRKEETLHTLTPLVTEKPQFTPSYLTGIGFLRKSKSTTVVGLDAPYSDFFRCDTQC